jgi:ABC-type branched-subunit amino acid transport system ATPase component
VGIGQLADLPVSQITYGQQRLVATARALAAEPRLLLLDEPAAGLSESEREALSNAIRRARDDGTTVLLVEHNVDFVMRLTDHVAVLHFGRKIADGAPDDVRRSEAVIEAYLAADAPLLRVRVVGSLWSCACAARRGLQHSHG